MYILAFVIALLASFLLTPYVKQLAFKIGAVDKPDPRKVHTRTMPRLGGLAIYLATVLAVCCSLPITRDLLGILLGEPGSYFWEYWTTSIPCRPR